MGLIFITDVVCSTDFSVKVVFLNILPFATVEVWGDFVDGICEEAKESSVTVTSVTPDSFKALRKLFLSTFEVGSKYNVASNITLPGLNPVISLLRRPSLSNVTANSTVNRFDSFWEASESGFSKSGVNVSFSFPWMKKILGPLSILETVDFFKDGVEVNLPLENDRMVVEILC